MPGKTLKLEKSSFFIFTYFIYAWVVLYSHYLSGDFAYHDVSHISDYLGSWLHGRGKAPFWVSQGEFSHGVIHFTPSFYLLMPFFRLFDSQFILMDLTVAAFSLSACIFLQITRELCEKYQVENRWEEIFSLSLGGIFLLSRFSKDVLLSANSWFLYIPFAAMVFLSLLQKKTFLESTLWFALALGVREDCGLYLGFLLLIFSFIEKKSFRGRAFWMAALAFTYSLTFALWIGPKMGFTSHIDRGWGHYGHHWAEIGKTILLSPRRLISDFYHSGFRNLNLSVYLLPVFNPVAFFLSNIPATLLYICDDLSKKYLWYYNASFVLPGIFVATILGAIQLVKRFPKIAKWILIPILPILLLTIRDTDGIKFWPKFTPQKTLDMRTSIAGMVKACPNLVTVSTDFHSTVFLPNSVGKKFLSSFKEADAVLIKEDLKPGEPGQTLAFQEEKRAIEEAGFTQLTTIGNVWTFVKNRSLCQ